MHHAISNAGLIGGGTLPSQRSQPDAEPDKIRKSRTADDHFLLSCFNSNSALQLLGGAEILLFRRGTPAFATNVFWVFNQGRQCF